MSEPFVILEHSGHGPTHFDFMLAAGQVLVTWQFASDPADLSPGAMLEGIRIDDHRTFYLRHEGEVSGGRGQVRRVEAGTYARLDPHREECWRFRLDGRRMAGEYELRRSGTTGSGWALKRIAESAG
jgi:hypothetical protein